MRSDVTRVFWFSFRIRFKFKRIRMWEKIECDAVKATVKAMETDAMRRWDRGLHNVL